MLELFVQVGTDSGRCEMCAGEMCVGLIQQRMMLTRSTDELEDTGAFGLSG